MKTYDPMQVYKSRCVHCNWVNDLYPSERKKQNLHCEKCADEKFGYAIFPDSKNSEVVGGLVHFIDSYNSRISKPKHYFLPEAHLPIVFACSHYESLVFAVVERLIKKYGNYIGRLGRFMIWEGTLRGGRYDVDCAKRIFHKLTANSLDTFLRDNFSGYGEKLSKLSKIRNEVLHGGSVSSDLENLYKDMDMAIDFIVESVDVFKALHNFYIYDFDNNVDVKQILRLAKDEEPNF